MTNDRYTPDELESIFVWDLICDSIPLTAEERREINERDRKIIAESSQSTNGKRTYKRRADMTPEELEAIRKKDRDRKRNGPKTVRSDASRADNNDRMKEYYRINKQRILAQQKQRRQGKGNV